jgi:aldehyde dehydrogenase (NAD+)
MTRIDHWINGRWTAPTSGAYREGTDPINGMPGPAIACGTAEDVDAAVAAAARAFTEWRSISSARRGALLRGLGESILANLDELARWEAEDTGKPVQIAAGEIAHAASFFEFYSTLVNLPIGEVLDVDPGQRVFTRREPYGVIGVITPWNLPLDQAARACAPALTAGNTVVIKPAEATSQSTAALARLASECGFPDGVLNAILGGGREVGENLVRHPSVRKVAFTGSVGVGRSIGRIAADRIIPVTLELGGKSANIVFADADLEKAVGESVRAFTGNAGQICSAGTRLLVQRDVFDDFVARVAERSRTMRPGHDYGPMITPEQYDQVVDYFDVAASEGAEPITGGTEYAEAGLGGRYLPPTIYVGVDNHARIAREEIFGPVLVALPFDTEAEAVEIANDSEFGLVAGVWTSDMVRAIRVSEALEVGQVFINTWSTGAVQAPFGGHKNSGHGREKGIEALSHYSHVKSITVGM